MPKKSRIITVFEKQEAELRTQLDGVNQRLADLRRMRQLFEAGVVTHHKKTRPENPGQQKMPGVA